MEEIKAPKKERKFLKAVGNIAKVLANELVMGIARKFIGKAIDKVGNKRQGLIIAFVILASSFAFAQYPATGNKQRLGYQTTGDGLVYRGRASDTVGIKSSGINNAYFILDTVNNILYNYIKTKGGWKFSNGDTVIINNNFTQPIDSLFFKTSVSPNNVDTAKMRWDSDLGTVVLGMYDQVPNELGFKNFWLVKNQTGSTITKGSLVYANGTVGASGRITVAKFIADGTIDAKYLLGITAHDLTDGEDGYVISFGKIRQVNTDTFAAGAILYPSPTTAGVWTDVEPVAPNIDMPIGFCINSSSNNGTISIRVASGYSLNELHNVAITSPVEKSSLFYSDGLWRDTTAALLVSDTASMLTPYFRDLDTTSLNLESRLSTKLNVLDTATMLLPYFRDADTISLNIQSRLSTKLNILDTATMLTPYFRDSDTTSLNLNSRFATKLNISDTASMLTNYLRSGVAASTYLPLTGGTLTGGLTGTTANFVGNFGIGTNTPLNLFEVSKSNNGTSTSLRITNSFSETGSTDETADIDFYQGSSGGYFTSGRVRSFREGDYLSANTQIAGGLSFWTQTSNAIPANGFTEKMRITSIGSVGIGTTNPQSTLEVHGSAVFNEGSVNSDFRVESDENANMVFVDASMDRVGIGTGTPSKTLDINGEVRIATVSATPTSLLGKDGSNVVGNVRLTSPLSLAGDSLNLGTVPISKGGTGATSASVARSTLDVGYVFVESTAGSSIILSSNRVSIVNTGGASTTSIDLTTATNGRQYMIKNLATGTVISTASNVIPFSGGSAGTAILSAGNVTPQWVTLVADGTNWHIMQKN
jgi:hypothetical protein